VASSRVVISWPYQPVRSSKAAAAPVPDIAGKPVRQAALALHRRGFRISLRGSGVVSRTAPPAGQTARPGTAVTVWAE
jgi:beta-lactam-binding protein with PASTA domain